MHYGKKAVFLMNVQWGEMFVAVRVWKASRLSAPPATEVGIKQSPDGRRELGKILNLETEKQGKHSV